jgi:putative phage-type endonuclease
MSFRILTGTSNNDEWLRLRQKAGIGASESAAILGDTNWGTPLTIWQQKLSDTVEDIGTERMEWGKRMESVIIDAIRDDYPEYGRVVPSEGLLQCVEHPHLIGTLDSMIDSPKHGMVPLEIKNVSAFERKNWFDELGQPHVPPKYQIQVLQQAFIRNDAPGGYVAALFDGNELVIIWVDRSQSFIDTHLLGTLEQFWRVNVLGGVPPEPILGDDLATLWPVVKGEEVEADETFLEMRERWIDAKVRESTAKADIETLKFYFGIYFETAEIATADGIPVMKMGTRQGQHRVKVATHADHHPDCTECVTQDKTSRSPAAVIQK